MNERSGTTLRQSTPHFEVAPTSCFSVFVHVPKLRLLAEGDGVLGSQRLAGLAVSPRCKRPLPILVTFGPVPSSLSTFSY